MHKIVLLCKNRALEDLIQHLEAKLYISSSRIFGSFVANVFGFIKLITVAV